MFIKVVACFVRAVRVRTIDIKHGAVVLAHYGRLGNTYDHFAKAIGDIVRDEALLSKNSDVAVSVIIQAIQEVCRFVRICVLISHIFRLSLSCYKEK